MIEKKSVDARDKGALKIVYGLRVEIEGKLKSSVPLSIAAPAIPEVKYELPQPEGRLKCRPVVVGAGPAGLFAALILAEAGEKPLLLERGDRIDLRDKAVQAFFGGGDLDPESNIQFGEGGAGSYSDGKLTTGVRDERGRNRKVIEELISAGAPPEIAYLAKPHVGTDKLIEVVANLRKKIEALGGEIRFRARVDSITVRAGARGERISGVIVNGSERIETGAVILAPGHSARDTFASLLASGVRMEQKGFAVGLRIEHPQEMISESQFGPKWKHPALPAADYKLAARTADDRGVYSFCMCPGGVVVNSSSEAGGTVCNGMSEYARGGRNANSAIVVSVGPGDFGAGTAGNGVLAGVEFQRRWERAAFRAGGGVRASGGHALPIQTLADFQAGRISTGLGGVRPCLTGAYTLAELGSCLPPYVAKGIREGILRFGRMIRGFDREDAVLTGVETRTSSPVRILRNEAGEASLSGLYPAGEGAGYAGGIMSAAMDGIRAAERVLAGGG
jgi:uncharacterized FAD-dependent dehydrogenase